MLKFVVRVNIPDPPIIQHFFIWLFPGGERLPVSQKASFQILKGMYDLQTKLLPYTNLIFF